jgi:hypothetical protein
VETPKREPPKHTRRSFAMDEMESLKPYKVGVQIPYGVYPEVPQKYVVRGTEAALGEVLRKLAEQSSASALAFPMRTGGVFRPNPDDALR